MNTPEELQAELNKVPESARAELACTLIGHSNILKGCWGYMACARCDEELGDSLGGNYKNPDCVIIDHNCEHCRRNWKRLTWKDKFMVDYTLDEKISP